MSPPAPQSQAPERGGGDWSDLPELLLLSIAIRLPNLSDFLSFGAVCRSWRLFFVRSDQRRLLSSRYLSSRPPLLLLPTPRRHPSFSISPYRFLSVDRPNADVGVKPLLDPTTRSHIGLGYSHGHLIFQILPSDPHIRLLISDPFTGREIFPPPPPPDEFPSVYSAAALSAPPDDTSCFLILLTLTSVVYRHLLRPQEEDHYTVHRLEDHFHVSSIVSFKSSKNQQNQQRRVAMYAINSAANELMEISSSDSGSDELAIKIHHLRKLYPGRSGISDGCYFGPQLAELDGELLAVLFVENEDCAPQEVRWLLVYKMGFEEMRWAEANHVLEKHAVFADTCGRRPIFVSEPEQWGGRCSRLYVVDRRRGKTWREFALDNGLVVPEYLSPPPILSRVHRPRWPAPIWIHPSFLF